MTGGVRQDAADTKSIPVDDAQTARTAAEIRALAEEAEAEAAEAEALATAARARSRALQLRRRAEHAEAQSQEAASKDEDQADAADSAQARAEEEAAPEGVEPDEPEAEAAESDAETVVAETESSASQASQAPARRWSRLRRPRWSSVAAGVALAVSLAALAGSAYVIDEHNDAGARRQHAAEFAAAARQAVVTMTSLDYHDAKAGVQRILDNATGSFKDDFRKTADDFVKVVEQSKVVSRGTVQTTGVDLDTMSDDSAAVLVASTQEVTNSAGAKQDPRNYRLIVTMAREGGQLKMSKIEFVP